MPNKKKTSTKSKQQKVQQTISSRKTSRLINCWILKTVCLLFIRICVLLVSYVSHVDSVIAVIWFSSDVTCDCCCAFVLLYIYIFLCVFLSRLKIFWVLLLLFLLWSLETRSLKTSGQNVSKLKCNWESELVIVETEPKKHTGEIFIKPVDIFGIKVNSYSNYYLNVWHFRYKWNNSS